MKRLPFYLLLLFCVQGFTQNSHSRKVVIYGPDMNNINNDEIRQSVTNGVTNALLSCGFQPRLNPERDRSDNPYDISKIEREVQEVLLKLYKDNEPIDAKDRKLLDKFKANIDTDTIAFTMVNWISRNNRFKLTVLFYDLNTLRHVNQIIEVSFEGEAIYESENIERELIDKLQLSSFCYATLEEIDFISESQDSIEDNKTAEQEKKQKEDFDLLIRLNYQNPNDTDLLWEILQIKQNRNEYISFLNRRTLFYVGLYKTTQNKNNQIRTNILNRLIQDYIELHTLVKDKEVKKKIYEYIEFFKGELERTPNNTRS